jgi:hypothetical protein
MSQEREEEVGCLMLLLAEKWVRVRAVSRGEEESSCLMLYLADKWVRVRDVLKGERKVVVSYSCWLRSGEGQGCLKRGGER